MELFVILLIAGGLGFIPAYIAESKGRNFGLWWLYGFALFIVALIHALALPGASARAMVAPASRPDPVSAADELTKFAELRDKGVLTEEEFATQKARILKSVAPSIVTG